MFSAVETAVGALTGPLLFGKLIETGKASQVFIGCIIGASLMLNRGRDHSGADLRRGGAQGSRAPAPRRCLRKRPRASRPRAERERTAPSPARQRRFGPREAGLSDSPVRQYASRVPNQDIDDEVAALAALRDAGPAGIDGRTLGERVNCRPWRPGRHRHALSTALARGALRQTERGRCAAEQAARSRRP